MTTQEIIDYYAGLLILQYIGRAKAFATIQTLVDPVIMDQLPVDVQNAFNLFGDSIATGVQLDVIGKYVGVTRNTYDFSGYVTLDDDDFLLLIQIKIIQNASGSSLYEIQNLLNVFFAGTLRVFDYADMTMDYFFEAAFGTQQVAEVFVRNGFLPRPMGVGLRATIFAPTGTTFFGFRTYQAAAPSFVAPFNTYSVYTMTWPWLSADDVLIF